MPSYTHNTSQWLGAAVKRLKLVSPLFWCVVAYADASSCAVHLHCAAQKALDKPGSSSVAYDANWEQPGWSRALLNPAQADHKLPDQR